MPGLAGHYAGLLADAAGEVRRDAAKALGAIGDRAAVETLIRAADRQGRPGEERSDLGAGKAG